MPLLILGMTILIPVNVGAGSLAESGTSNVNANTTEIKFLFSSIDKLSISNVPNGSPRLWAHLVMSYVFTGWVCFILFMEYKSIAALRLKFLSDEKRRPDQFTVSHSFIFYLSSRVGRTSLLGLHRCLASGFTFRFHGLTSVLNFEDAHQISLL